MNIMVIKIDIDIVFVFMELIVLFDCYIFKVYGNVMSLLDISSSI